METLTTDVLVVGSGGAGLTAATVAATRGLNVILVEKTAVFGGTTAWSGGGIWVPCNSLAKAAGLHDGVEQARAYIKGVIGPTVREDLVDAFLGCSPDMVDFLQGNTSVKFSLQEGFADWYQDVCWHRLNSMAVSWGRICSTCVKRCTNSTPRLA